MLAIAPSLAKAATIGAARAGDASACIAAIAKRTAACVATDNPWAAPHKAAFAPRVRASRRGCGHPARRLQEPYRRGPQNVFPTWIPPRGRGPSPTSNRVSSGRRRGSTSVSVCCAPSEMASTVPFLSRCTDQPKSTAGPYWK